MPQTSPKILFILPTYNEEGSIGELLTRLNLDASRHALIIDDGSTDQTVPVINYYLKSLPVGTITVINRPYKLGLGSAYQLGFSKAIAVGGYDYIFQLDADLSHDPGEVSNFLKAIEEPGEGIGMVLGSRYVGGIRILNWPLRRLILSKLAATYVRFWTGLKLTDPTSGYKCFAFRTLQEVMRARFKGSGYAFQVEVNFLIQRQGFRIKEIPIVFKERECGCSKLSLTVIAEAIFLVPLLRWVHKKVTGRFENL